MGVLVFFVSQENLPEGLNVMSRQSHLLSVSLRFLIEAALALALFVGVAWGLTRLAEHQADRPLRPNPGGLISLPVSQATVFGGLRLRPVEKERQAGPFAYHFGRELKEERDNRKIVDWTSLDDCVEWQFQLDASGVYEVEAELAVADEEAGSEYEITVEEQVLSATTIGTGGPAQWKMLRIGSLNLPAGTHTLSVRARKIQKRTLMNLSHIVLLPLQ